MSNLKVFFGVAASALLIAGCQTAGTGDAASAIQVPDGYKPIVTNPDPAKWKEIPRGTAVEFLCLPLACSYSTKIIINSGPSPTTKPDREALLRFAQAPYDPRRFPASWQDGATMEKLAGTVETVRNYPAATSDYRRTLSDGKVFYFRDSLILAGDRAIRMGTLSEDRAYTQPMSKLFHRHLLLDK
ncbi:MAG: hypothetical protein ACRCXM_08325 [Beijerinckiaceae bacterium]